MAARSLRAAATAIGAALALAAPAGADEPVALAWKWKKGETLRYRVIREVKQLVTSDGEPDQEGATRTVAVCALTVEDAPPEAGALVALAWESLTTTDGSGAVLFDSARPDAPETTPAMRAFGKAELEPLSFEVSRSGRIGAVREPKRILENAKAALAPFYMGHAPWQVLEQFEEHGLRRSLEEWLHVLPDGPASASWTAAAKVVMGDGALDTVTTFALETLSARDGEHVAKLRLQSVTTRDEQMARVAAQLKVPIARVKTASGSGTGSVFFAVEPGRLVGLACQSAVDYELEHKGLDELKSRHVQEQRRLLVEPLAK